VCPQCGHVGHSLLRSDDSNHCCDETIAARNPARRSVVAISVRD